MNCCMMGTKLHIFSLLCSVMLCFLSWLVKVVGGIALLMAKMVDDGWFCEEFLGDVMQIHYLCSNLCQRP